MKIVSNELFNQSVANTDYIRIGYAATKPFKLDSDARKECWLIGLWTALKKYDATGCKFTTYLYKAIRWECIKMIRKNPPKSLSIKDLIYHDSVNIFDDIDAPCKELIYDKIIGRLTLRELSFKYKKSIYSIRKLIKTGLNSFKN